MLKGRYCLPGSSAPASAKGAGSAAIAIGNGPAGLTLTFEWKITGGTYVEMADQDTLTPANLSGKQLILAITPSSAIDLDTVATNRPNLLAENGDNTGTLTANTQNEVPFDMAVNQLAGIVVITLTIDGTDYTFTFHCFQFAGTLRAVNTGEEATTGITVNGVDIGDAAAGHASLSAAHTAASDDDVLVPTEAFNDSTGFAMTKEVVVDVDDSVRGSKTRAGLTTGYYLSAQNTLQSANIIIRNLNFSAGGGAGTSLLLFDLAAGDGATYLLENLGFYKVSSFQAFATLPTSGHTIAGTVRNCIAYVDTGASGFVLNGDTSTLTLQNCTTHGIDAQKGFWNNSTGGTMNLSNCVSLGTFASSQDYLTNGGTFNGGDNNVGISGGNVAAASATTSATTTAGAYFTSTTASAEDAHCVSAAVNDDFPGVDLSASFDTDIDGDIRTAWYAGADFVAA